MSPHGFPPPPTLVAPPRFEILHRLGRGGMGVVYAARDRDRGLDVALKTLHKLEPTTLYRFKREFRALADVTHPCLATLYELLSEGDRWFYTMELVDGVDFIEHVRGHDASQPPRAKPDSEGSRQDVPTEVIESAATAGSPARARSPAESALVRPSNGPSLDLGRLRAGLLQLVDGLCAVHSTGRLHRDIKPSNVLVATSGRLVILDFGLVADFGERDPDGAWLRGTPLYMAPEQALAEAALTPACDWYAVGVVLYEALTGRRPFEGDPVMVLRAKKEKEPTPPAVRVPSVPRDLNDLCIALLRIDPACRPSGDEILARLRIAAGQPSADDDSLALPQPLEVIAWPTGAASASSGEVELVGRSEHTRVLADALAAIERGQGTVLFLHGGSGVGKSELVHHFLSGVAAERSVVVLEGRCYERESVPFNGIDSLVDSLTDYLLRLPHHEVHALLPEDVATLGRVLPVLRRVEAIAEARPPSPAEHNPHELRRRAFRALRELLGRLAERHTTVLFIDDLHWGDADSGALLAEIMRPPATPPILLIGTYRTDEAELSALLRAFRGRTPRIGPASPLRELAVEPLSRRESHELAARLLSQAIGDQSHAAAVAVESGGNPYFIHELVRFLTLAAEPNGQPRSLAAVRLDEVVAARTSHFPDQARRLLEIVCLAGRPVPWGIARRVVSSTQREDADTKDWPAGSAIELLRSQHLVRMRGARDEDQAEPYHDRIRVAVLRRMEPRDRKRGHHGLAVAYESSGHADPETLATHYIEAGEPAAAVEHVLTAAEQAGDALAFERAATLYALALELSATAPTKQKREVARRLAEALANAGRGAEAAAAYLDAALDADAFELIELRRRAAYEYLRAGYLKEGMAQLSAVLRAAGCPTPASNTRILLGVLLRRGWLRLRGLGFVARAPEQVSPRALARLDAYWAAAAGLLMVDPVRATDYHVRHLLLALRTGDSGRVTRALTLHFVVAASVVQEDRTRAEDVRKLAESLLREHDAAPTLFAWLEAGSALLEYQSGCFSVSLRHAREAVRIARSHGVGGSWEHASAQLYEAWSLYYLGEIAALSERVDGIVEDAQQRGDRFAAASARLGVCNLAWLAADDPDGAEHAISVSMQDWAPVGYHLQHYWALFARVQCDLYRGHGAEAHERLRREWRRLRRSLFFRVKMVRIEATHLRARAALAAAANSGEPEPLLRIVERLARRLEREQIAWARPLAAMLRASVAVARKDRATAAELFAVAESGLAESSLGLLAAVALRRRGELLGESLGQDSVARADAHIAEQGILRPDRVAYLFAPQ